LKTIGMIGGMSWESSIEYYRIANEAVHLRLGGVHSARIVMYSVDFAEVETLQSQGRWQEATQMMIDAAQRVERGGADFLVICTNTMHKMADEMQSHLHIPILHIADATADQVKACGMKKIGLLGTRFTMEEDFYRGRLEYRHHLEVLIPGFEDRTAVHRVIYEQLVVGVIRAEAKAQFGQIIQRLVEQGAEGIILGCTEIGLLVKDEDCQVPLFDTARIHALAAVEYALAK
jgi:aspartate racemase